MRGIRGVGLLFIAIIILIPSFDLFAQEEKGEKEKAENNGKKGYEKFTAEDALRQEGMFDVINIGKNYYLEISDEMLGRDMLIGERISELSSSKKVAAGEMRKAPVLIRFTRDDDNVYMHQVISAYEADENDAVSIAVKRTSIDPILHTFSIEALNEDSTAAVIEVTTFYSEEIKVISPVSAKYKAG